MTITSGRSEEAVTESVLSRERFDLKLGPRIRHSALVVKRFCVVR